VPHQGELDGEVRADHVDQRPRALEQRAGARDLVADQVADGRRDTALRVALGAPAWRIAGRVFTDGARLATGGLIVGAIAAYFVARWVTQITGNEQSIPWLVWLLAPAMLVAAVAIASVFPARDAMATDPLSLMRGK